MGTRALSPRRSTGISGKAVSPKESEAFASSSSFRQQVLSDEKQEDVSSRRETFVYPAQAVVESTPKLKNRPQAGFRDPRRETFIDLQNSVPAIETASGHNFRRETFIPETFDNFVKPQNVRRETFVPQKGPINLELNMDPETPIRRQTYVTLPSAEATTKESWTPQKVSPVLPDNKLSSRKTYTKLPKKAKEPEGWTPQKPSPVLQARRLNETSDVLSWTPQKASPVLPEATNVDETQELLSWTPQKSPVFVAASNLAAGKDFKTSISKFVTEVCTDMVGLSLSPDNSVFEPEDSIVEAPSPDQSKYQPCVSDISDVPLNLTMPRKEPKPSIPEVVVSFHETSQVPNLSLHDETDNFKPEMPNKMVVIFDDTDRSCSPRYPKDSTDSPCDFNYTLEHKNMVSLKHMQVNESMTQGNESMAVNLSRNVHHLNESMPRNMPLDESMAVNMSKNMHLD